MFVDIGFLTPSIQKIRVVKGLKSEFSKMLVIFMRFPEINSQVIVESMFVTA